LRRTKPNWSGCTPSVTAAPENTVSESSSFVWLTPLTMPRRITLSVRGGAPTVHEVDGAANNMVYEVARFAELVRGEADAAPDQQRSLAVLRAVEAIRAA